jgi:hypothetical protein
MTSSALLRCSTLLSCSALLNSHLHIG